MKPILIIFFLFISFINCKDAKESKNQPLDSLNRMAITETVNDENKRSENIKENTSNTEATQDDWYWKNTTMSKNNKFENWSEGEVTLVMNYRIKQNDMQPRSINVGSIDTNGDVSLYLPKEIETETKLDNLGNLVFYDIEDISSLKYENGNTGYFSNTSLKVEKNGTVIGELTLGNSVRTTYNLTNQSTLTMGDEGYLIYLVYVEEMSSMKAKEIKTAKVRRDGTNTIEAETTVVYDLELKPGWNYVKTAVIGNYDLKHERGLNASWFKAHEHTVITDIPKEAEYFFRKNSY